MKHGRRDSNHTDVVKWYRDLGCSVFDLADVALGCPDLLVGMAGVTCIVEVKSADGTLTGLQKTFLAGWRGGEVTIVRTQDEVIAHVQAVRKRFAA
jgi:hypothetical protein